MSALIDTWHISDRINEYLLSGIDESHFTDVSLGKGRTVGQAFAHLHNVRLMWAQWLIKQKVPHLAGLFICTSAHLHICTSKSFLLLNILLHRVLLIKLVRFEYLES